jgi:hypothetical protein
MARSLIDRPLEVGVSKAAIATFGGKIPLSVFS